MKHLSFLLYAGAVVALFFYSYTQVDLSLTLSQFSLWQVIEKGFQYIGYFQRPLSTGIFLLLMVLFYISYIQLFSCSLKKQLSRENIWRLIIFTAVVLTFSYNAFSYDLFNYIFDAKIVTHYHLNPYFYKALDFPQDPMLSFMHWTQRTYPYGPLWLLVTVPFSFIGMQFFLPTFFLFKMLASASYVGCAYFVEQITKKVSPGKELSAVVFFALSPLVIIEGLVSAHNDMLMMFFALISAYLLLQHRFIRSFFVLAISIGIKFATATLFPLYILVGYLVARRISFHPRKIFIVSSLLMLLPIIAASLRTNFQPWYLLYALPFVAISVESYYLIVPGIIFPLFALLEYAPFLFQGDWNGIVPLLLTFFTTAGIVVSIIVIATFYIRMTLVRRLQHATIQ